jgi:hypothetical protein
MGVFVPVAATVVEVIAGAVVVNAAVVVGAAVVDGEIVVAVVTGAVVVDPDVVGVPDVVFEFAPAAPPEGLPFWDPPSTEELAPSSEDAQAGAPKITAGTVVALAPTFVDSPSLGEGRSAA